MAVPTINNTSIKEVGKNKSFYSYGTPNKCLAQGASGIVPRHPLIEYIGSGGGAMYRWWWCRIEVFKWERTKIPCWRQRWLGGEMCFIINNPSKVVGKNKSFCIYGTPDKCVVHSDIVHRRRSQSTYTVVVEYCTGGSEAGERYSGGKEQK